MLTQSPARGFFKGVMERTFPLNQHFSPKPVLPRSSALPLRPEMVRYENDLKIQVLSDELVKLREKVKGYAAHHNFIMKEEDIILLCFYIKQLNELDPSGKWKRKFRNEESNLRWVK